MIKSTYLFGNIIQGYNYFNHLELFENSPKEATVLKKIKIWFGIPPQDENKEKLKQKSLLGIKCFYENYYNFEKKESEYSGCELIGDDVETKELEISQGDYFTKMNFGFVDYITHIKFTTYKGNVIEFGKEDKETEKILYVNQGNNMILFLFGRFGKEGIRALGTKYISRKDYFMRKYKEIFWLRGKFKNKDFAENYIQNMNKYDESIKYLIMICSKNKTPDNIFYSIIKYY